MPSLVVRGLGSRAIFTRGLGPNSYTPARGNHLIVRGLGARLIITRGLGRATAVLPDLLSAVVQRLLATPAVRSLLGTSTNVFFDLAEAGDTRPFIVVESYVEHLPGETADDQVVPLDICIVCDDSLDLARRVGEAVKRTLDTPTINRNSAMLAPLVFSGGRVIGVMRNNSTPRRMPGQGKSGARVYKEQIQYEFWVTPEQ